MRVAHLFAGIGGGLLADLILGHTPFLAVEQDEYCCQVLEELRNEGWFPGLHVHCGDIQKFDFEPWRGRVDQIAAGFPCQDISCANTGGKGIKGERSGLVREVWRAVDTIRPAFVFLENSPRIRTKGRIEVIRELVARGYSWRDGTLEAADVGAPHKRNRWWLLAANTTTVGLQPWSGLCDFCTGEVGGLQFGHQTRHAKSPADSDGFRKLEQEGCIPKQRGRFSDGTKETSDSLRDGLQIAIQRGGLSQADAETIQATAGYTGACNWSPPDAGVRGMVHGISHRQHRIKALGNAQVPLQAAVAFALLAWS